MSGAARHTEELRLPAAGADLHGASAAPEDGRRRVFIEAVEPLIDGGEYAVKRTLGDTVTVSANLVADGHDVLAGEVLVRRPDQPEPYLVVPLELQANHRYAARFDVDMLGPWQYTLQGWVDGFASWRRGLSRKLEAKQNVHVELLEGAELVSAAARRARGNARENLEKAARALAQIDSSPDQRAQRALSPELLALMAAHPDRSRAKRLERWLPIWVDRERARFGAWYEMFPRSTGTDGKHGNFETSRALLPYIAGLGFDILYLPPIHPIGITFRKGKNNQPNASPGDVGSPWAIGGSDGGHKAIHPALGTLEDFDRFVSAAREHGLELALDIALQVTPDHPYVKEHPEWFKRRPDGSIQYAENPPKKYQDIYPFDFDSEAWWSLWLELRSIFEFWMDRGVRIFRVDNPHTKPLRFWRWCIAELRRTDPNLLFLAEAFTHPRLMHLLAKVGFTQSYTYFTWRTTRAELESYVRELSSPPLRDFFRPNFWTNTPDILPEHLQHAARPAFALRLVLAATLSSNYGMYGPAFELGANVPRPGAEEYLDNEKYELRRWQLGAESSLAPLIRRINAIRRDNPALQYDELSFCECDNPSLLCYLKRQPSSGRNHPAEVKPANVVLVVVNLDPHNAQAGWVRLDASQVAPLAASARRGIQLHDLLTDARYFSEGERLFVRLDPASTPAHIFRLRQHVRSEHDFDYFE